MLIHKFKIGDRVRNGHTKGTVVRLISDDALEVVYDNDDSPFIEPAFYFEKLLKGCVGN